MVILKRTHLAEITRHLEESYPDEACGVLIGRREGDGYRVLEASPVPNASSDRAGDRYEMAPEALLAAERAARDSGRAVIGAFHSHPNGAGRPSPVDLERAWGEYCYLIVSVRGGEAAEWACWVLNEKERRFEPIVVRLED